MRVLSHAVVVIVTLYAELVFGADAPAGDARAKTRVVTIRERRGPEGELVDAVDLELVRIPAGRITLKGADGKAAEHEVKAIWMGKYEVRWDEYYIFSEQRDLREQDRWHR
jgi:hypothetical protein